MIGKQRLEVDLLIPSIIPFVLFLTLIGSAHSSAAVADFVAFYPEAEARSQSPPNLSSLSILCSQKSKEGYTTFVGVGDKKVLLVVFTDKRVKDLAKVITLEPVFTKPSGKKDGVSFPSPTARVGPDATLDWAYVYDRNGDGRVDYVAFLFAALPVKPDDFPADYPKGPKIDFKDKEQRKLILGLIITHARLIFSHHADDNFDGASDAFVGAVLDPDRYPWVEEFGVLRSTRYDGNVDETWTFKKSITEWTGTVEQTDQRYIIHNAPDIPRRLTGKEWLAFGSELMKVINDRARECGLTKESFLKK